MIAAFLLLFSRAKSSVSDYAKTPSLIFSEVIREKEGLSISSTFYPFSLREIFYIKK
jgi:hypothetical protein